MGAFPGKIMAEREDNRLIISGSTTILPMAMAAAEEYQKIHPQIQISVSGTGTGEGLKSLVDGVIDIAGASRDILPTERSRAIRENVTLRRHTVALDSLAVITHPDNPIKDLSIEELHDIYVGVYKNWKELGGHDRPIIAINRDSSSGTFEMWLELVLLGERYRKDAQTQPSSGGVAYAVGGNKNAIGYVGLGFLTSKVKVLTVNGVGPELPNVASGAYPLSRELYMFTEDPTPERAGNFIEFMGSEAGRKIIESEGFLPPLLKAKGETKVEGKEETKDEAKEEEAKEAKLESYKEAKEENQKESQRALSSDNTIPDTDPDPDPNNMDTNITDPGTGTNSLPGSASLPPKGAGTLPSGDG
jgi:phosphate transport system substrate-binding protein